MIQREQSAQALQDAAVPPVVNQATEMLEKAKREKADEVAELRAAHASELQVMAFDDRRQLVQIAEQAEAFVRERKGEMAQLAASLRPHDLQTQAQSERIASVCRRLEEGDAEARD